MSFRIVSHPFPKEPNHVDSNFSSRLVSSRLVSAVLLAMIAAFAPSNECVAAGTPNDLWCQVLAPAGLDGTENICLDDWIRFNSKLWVDLFWPTPFDLAQPMIFVDERVGAWANTFSTTGRNSQGNHIWIDVGVPLDLINYQQLLAQGAINPEQYQQILNSDAAVADTVAILTDQEYGWQVVMHAMVVTMRLQTDEYLSMLVPYEEFDFKAAAVQLGDTPPACVVDVCICPDGTLPDETQTAAYTTAMCALQNANAQRFRNIRDAYNSCWWTEVGLGGAAIVGGCLGLACPSGITQVGGAIVIGAGATSIVKGVGDCKTTRTAALEAIVRHFDLQQQLRCLQACIATP